MQELRSKASLEVVSAPSNQPGFLDRSRVNRAAAKWMIERMQRGRSDANRAEEKVLRLSRAALKALALDYTRAHRQ